jgi:pilus assembly protein CpaE
VTFSVLLGVGSHDVGVELRALLEESGDFRVLETAPTAGDLITAIGRREVDAILIHEQLGPVPVLDLVRELVARYPHIGVVLIVREGTAEVLTRAMEAGARGIITLPLSLDEVQARLGTAAAWSRTVRRHLSGDLADLAVGAGAGVGGTLVVVSGAKGGVGASTVAAHLALLARTGGPQQRRVCLVDLDLQAGDLPQLLNLTYHRTITDLVEVSDELTARALEETLYTHPSGLRVLLGPAEGERSEDITGRVAKQVLGGLKARFDVVVVDCGTTVTEANAVAVEMADQVLVVATPDVLCLRAAKRLIKLWGRLQVRKDDDLMLVMNRTSKANEVQPDLAQRVVGVPLARSTLPAAFRSLEPALNSGSPQLLEDGALQRALIELAQETGVVPLRRSGGGRRGRRGGGGEAGSVSVEVLGISFLVLLILAGMWQGILCGYTLMIGTHAANEGARKLAVHQDFQQAAEEDLPQAWRDQAQVSRRGSRVLVTLTVPTVMPGLASPLRFTMSAGTVVE